MSEELLQTVPQQIGRYTYYRLGATNLDQLRKHGLIPQKDYAILKTKKPDGLVIYHKTVKAVVEYKQPKDLDTPKKIEKAIKQELAVAKALCKILIVTDGSKTIWINALNGERIVDASLNPVTTVFHPVAIKRAATIEFLIGEIDASIGASNSAIKSAKLIDPSPLAGRLWQTIWVATGKSPVKCLYNVVELFIFKFLSDLAVLPNDFAFDKIYSKALHNSEDALEFYAKNTRTEIYKLFPKGTDGTTIINGTIFVNEKGEANVTQAILFRRSLEHLKSYAEEFGSLTKIDKQFKTKLYESFLQQEVEALGQYFTPRRVIQSVIRMAGIDSPSFPYQKKRICDPFCGVGGFPLEILNMNEQMADAYTPDAQGMINPPFVLQGFDKGFERDDERTIILAKANMLIYLAEKLFRYPGASKEFAKAFNKTFRLFKDNLGTFGYIPTTDEERYDLLLSNPPYVTSGSSIIKEQIRNTPHTASEYPINALGLEGISMEWIVKALRPNGRAFIVIPDGILGRVGGKKLRDYFLRECFLDGIVSLPIRTFFSNWERTYVLVMTKKPYPEVVQVDPVFTYVVSNIGERLTSVKREEIEADDLPEMENLFRIFSGAKAVAGSLLENYSLRCKVQPIARFQSERHWVVDRWWTKAERVAAGIEDAAPVVDSKLVENTLSDLVSALKTYEGQLEQVTHPTGSFKRITLGDTSLFTVAIGNRVLKANTLSETTTDHTVPVFSANVYEPMGYVKTTSLLSFDSPSLLWGIDGNFEFNLLDEGVIFEHTDHCGRLQILDQKILPEYILAALYTSRLQETFDRSFRASLTNMRTFAVDIPMDNEGNFDLEAQKVLAEKFRSLEEARERVAQLKSILDSAMSAFVT